MTVRRWAALSLIVALALVVGAAFWLLGPTGPAPLPPTAGPLVLRTQPWKIWPPSGFSCGMAALTPIRVEQDGVSMVFVNETGDTRVPAVWPNGYSARLLNGRAELVQPNGAVLARDGDLIKNLASGAADNGDFLICMDFASKPLVEPSP